MITRLFLSYIVDETRKLSPAQQEEMMMAFRVALKLLGTRKKEMKEVPLLQKFVSVLQSNVIPCFDQFPLSFFSLPLSQKQAILKEKISQDSCLNSSLIHIFSFFTAEDVQKQLSRFLNIFSSRSRKLFVKSVRDVDGVTRADIRSHYPEDFIVFKVQKTLLGGMQIYNQGKLFDATWKGKVDALNHMLSQ